MLLTKKSSEKIQEISKETCQRRKRIKKGNIKGKYTTHMNTDLNERLKQYQRNYYASKKRKN